MTTERLYYTDSYSTTFVGRVLEALDIEGRPAVVLDRSLFYPTSGGQPFDLGTLDDAQVVGVVDLDAGRVAHVLDRAKATGTEVRGTIDWNRRFDHMQQHTGQHVLSAAFDRKLAAPTESFHLGAETCTIDLGTAVTPEQVLIAETDANRVVWEDRPVTVRLVSPTDARSLPLRKESARTGLLRLVDIEHYDLSACGGTHVARTGGIGIIAVSGHERFKGGTRVEFVCGGRALGRLRRDRDGVAGCVRQLSVLPEELPAALERLQTQLKDQRAVERGLQARLVGYAADELSARGTPAASGTTVIEALEGHDATSLKALAAALITRPQHVAVLFSHTRPALVVAAASEDTGVDARAVLRGLVDEFGGKGGGRRELAQGGGLDAPVEELLAAAARLVGRQ
jgi:alanyl-tRNA synthetase